MALAVGNANSETRFVFPPSEEVGHPFLRNCADQSDPCHVIVSRVREGER